ncbi:MAG TPA: HmuY family protein [Chitinophagaceae bacterium]|nr:HmuY family protein [Chitinophagaceae bacterium]
MKNVFRMVLVVAATGIVFASCRKRDAVLPDNYVVFETSSQGITATESSVTVKLKLTGGVSADIPVVLNLTEQGVVYGTDYTTTPAAVAGKVTLTVPSGNNEASFTINKVAGVLYDGDEKIIADIFSSGNPVLIGTIKQFTLSFGELVASAASMTVNGGGATYPNKVFIDLSANRQTGVQRTTWDLGFYTGSEYRVTLNSSLNMMAKQMNKNDLNTVSAADTVGFAADVTFSQTAPTTASLAYIDYPNGDLTRTAVAEVSATATDNKVYIVNRGNGIGTGAANRGWKKIRIIRNAGGGYTLQHADIAATSFTSVDIAKEDATYFKYVSFETGSASVEPQKKKWDLAWTYFANATNFGGGEVPYMFQDIILMNRNVQVAKVLVATKPFDDFAEADIAAQTFLTTQNAIASDWRSGGGPSSAPAVRTDRYYIIKDGDNNYYKVRFTALTQNGERGYPAFESVLVKKG